MVSKSRLAVALALVLALGVSGVAFGTAAENDAKVDGKITPRKLDAKKFKKVSLLLGVRNSDDFIDGTQSNPASEFIKMSKNIRLQLGRAQRCQVTLASGTPTEVARQMCPRRSVIGQGEAEVKGPGAVVIAEPKVTVFVGPGRNDLQLHTYSPDLGAASPVVPAKIVRAKGKKWGQALDVPNAPQTGALMITKFNATIKRQTGVVTARCKPRKFTFARTVTYDDGTSETVRKQQRCTVKKGKGGKRSKRARR